MRERQLILMGGLLGLGLVAVAAAPAWAQMAGMPGGATRSVLTPEAKTNPDAGRATSALPGATPGRGVTPADKSTIDLAPNAALFDAINRGDIAEARDAVGRGADIQAKNVLGMTPLEASVDLSRNDITFFLLSLRGATAGALAPPSVAESVAGSGARSAPVAPVAAAKLPMKVARSAPRAAAHRAAPAPVPRQYAVTVADPGQPDPQAGFLGFGGSAQ